MYTRSEVRHALYRMKNRVPKENSQDIYDTVTPMIPVNESWETFSVTWDVMVVGGVITIVSPEMDYEFIHSTCIRKSLADEMGISQDLSARQQNVIQVVELSMLPDLMSWSTYDKTWGIYLDRDLKRIHTKLFSTKENKIIVDASKQSDGAAMTQLPTIPIVEVAGWKNVSEEEKRMIDIALRKNNG